MILFHRLGRGAAMSAVVVSACLAMPAAAAAAGTKSTAYYASDSNDTAYLIDWYATGNKVRVAGQGGASIGTYVDDGTQKLITLATPLSETWLYTYDDCGTVYAKSAVRQLVVRDLPDGLARIFHEGAAAGRQG